jgi:phage-related holin
MAIKPKSATRTQTKPVTKHEIVSIHQFSKIAMTFWLGGSWMIILVILPIIFKTLDQITASNVTGQILSINAYIGIVALIIALIEVMINHKFSLLKTKTFWYILAMGFTLLINHFAILPVIHNVKQKLSLVVHQVIAAQPNVFDFWHSLSVVLYAITCIIGVLFLIEI